MNPVHKWVEITAIYSLFLCIGLIAITYLQLPLQLEICFLLGLLYLLFDRADRYKPEGLEYYTRLKKRHREYKEAVEEMRSQPLFHNIFYSTFTLVYIVRLIYIFCRWIGVIEI